MTGLTGKPGIHGVVAGLALSTLVAAAPAPGGAKSRKATAAARSAPAPTTTSALALPAAPAASHAAAEALALPVLANSVALARGPQDDAVAAADPLQAAPAENWLDEAPTPPAEVRRGRVGTALLMLVTVAAGIGGTLAWQRRRNKPAKAQSAESIHLLATKALGSKQRLALIEVCGERLLLASCDGEVTLLSHLPGAAPSASAEDTERAEARSTEQDAPVQVTEAPRAAAQQAAERPSTWHTAAAERAPSVAPPQPTAAAFSAVLATKMPAAATEAQLPPPLPAAAAAGELSSDLAGLRAWRAQSSKGYEVRA